MAELFHITERAVWLDAVRAGDYRMSTRGVATGRLRGLYQTTASDRAMGITVLARTRTG